MGVKILFVTLCLGSVMTAKAQQSKSIPAKGLDTTYLLVGSYATSDEEAIKVYRFDEQTGDAKYISGLKGIPNPSFLTSSADGKNIFTVSEGDGKNPTANAIKFNKGQGTLTLLNSQPTGGDLPCYIILSPTEKFVVTANYMGGSITVFPLDKEGKLLPDTHLISFTGNGPNKERQEQPHLHCVIFTPDRENLLANDLGTDRMYVFPVSKHVTDGMARSLLDETRGFNIQMEPGSGPRHICFHPNSKFAYLISELSGKITTFSYKSAKLERLQTIVCDTAGACGSADIHVSNDGKFLYASNRLKADGIAIFSIHPEKGTLTKVGYQLTGIYPRNFSISPNGRYLLVICRDSNCIQIFERNKNTGLLKDTGKTIKMNKPAYLEFP